MTLSPWFSPARNLIFGALGISPHSQASLSTRRKARKVLFIVLISHSCICLNAAKSAACSVPIPSSFALASFLYDFSALIPKRYQRYVLGAGFSNVAFAHGSMRFRQNSSKVGTVFFSRIPTSPLANDVRCAASICRATLSLPCLVDSRTVLPFHMNLYQYISPRL